MDEAQYLRINKRLAHRGNFASANPVDLLRKQSANEVVNILNSIFEVFAGELASSSGGKDISKDGADGSGDIGIGSGDEITAAAFTKLEHDTIGVGDRVLFTTDFALGSSLGGDHGQKEELDEGLHG